jgi:hypothetical protein
MTSPELTRMEYFRQVRVILVRHMIDIGQLSIQISTNRLRLHGSLCRLPGVTTELTPAIVRTIFSELGMIRGIRRVDGDFDNWQQLDQLGAAWAPIQAKKLGARPPLIIGSPGVIEVDDAQKPDPSQG